VPSPGVIASPTGRFASLAEMETHLTTRKSSRLLLAALIVSLAACNSAARVGAAGSPTVGPSSTSALPSASPSARERAADAVRIRPPRGGSFLVRGSYPFVASRCVNPEQPKLTARYPGTLLVRLAGDGSLTLTVTLPFQRYLEGIAEVPPSWPAAALDAQAIAARSYALASTGWDGQQGETLDTPICATTACQVFAGIPVPWEPVFGRWVQAVRRTANAVLLYQGRPATTFYFSTSNGRTYGNDQVFGSSPLPYLRPVVERDDGASPLSRWRATVPFDDLARFLRSAGEWPGGQPITSVRPLAGDDLLVSGGGTSRRIDFDALQDAVNVWGPCLVPDRYPPASGTGGRLPLTIPSDWSSVSTAGGSLVVTGRGWGHGVGMVQWGAYGKARRGLSAERILAFYYGGLRPRRHPEPGLIHVRVASGLTRLRLKASGPGVTLDGHPVDSETVVVTGGDRLHVKT
jgi:SpoIID/LytB domain protein